jgi:hypothetical protein
MSYYCNKCGWIGESPEHEKCDYLAGDMDWREKAIQHDLDIANARIKELEGVNLALIAERDKLSSLSVTDILLEVVPGDGDGLEVYAKSVGDVEKMLNDLSCSLEDAEIDLAGLKATNKDAKNHFDALKADYDALLKEREESMKQEPVGYVRIYGIECLQGTLMNKTMGRIPLPSSTQIDPFPQADDDIKLYAAVKPDIGFIKAAYQDGYTDREEELRKSSILISKTMPPAIPEIRQISNAKLYGDQSVIVDFTSCRAASAFHKAMIAASPAYKKGE